MRQVTRVCYHLLGISLSMPGVGYAQYPKATAGASLEIYYRKLLSECDSPVTGPSASALPKEVKEFSGMSPGDPVMVVLEGTVSADKVFTHVFPDDQIWEIADKAALVPTAQLTSLGVGALPFRGTQTAVGASSLYRSDTCGTALSAAANVAGGLGLPFFSAHAEAALKAQSNRQYHLFVLLGDFVSPLYYQLTDSRTAFGARMHIWQHYHDNATSLVATYSTPHYLASFTGGAVYYSQDIQTETEMSLSASAGVNVLFAKADASTRDRVDFSTVTNVKEYAMFIRKNPAAGFQPIAHLEKLPSPKDIRGWIVVNVAPRIIPSQETAIVHGRPFAHEFVIPGLPEEFCEVSRFQVKSSTDLIVNESTVKLLAATVKSPCQISAVFNTRKVSFADMATPLALRYTLLFQARVNGEQLEFPAYIELSKRQAVAVEAPVAGLVGIPAPTAQSASSVVWRAPLAFVDAKSLLDKTGESGNALAAKPQGTTCRDMSAATIDVGQISFAGLAGGTLDFSWTPGVLSVGQTLSTDGAPCTVSFSVELPLKEDRDGNVPDPIQQTLIVRVRGPRLNSSPALVVATAAGQQSPTIAPQPAAPPIVPTPSSPGPTPTAPPATTPTGASATPSTPSSSPPNASSALPPPPR